MDHETSAVSAVNSLSTEVGPNSQHSPYSHGLVHPQQQPPMGIDPNVYRQPTLTHSAYGHHGGGAPMQHYMYQPYQQSNSVSHYPHTLFQIQQQQQQQLQQQLHLQHQQHLLQHPQMHSFQQQQHNSTVNSPNIASIEDYGGTSLTVDQSSSNSTSSDNHTGNNSNLHKSLSISAIGNPSGSSVTQSVSTAIGGMAGIQFSTGNNANSKTASTATTAAIGTALSTSKATTTAKSRAPNARSRKSEAAALLRAASTSQSLIYSAVYSGVRVYEMMCRDVAVMRRCHDSYLNATQLLKVAGVDKGRRTKILEKQIIKGDHEKVQGGYGKYQGTWIPFTCGVQLAQQYELEELLKPLLTFAPDESPSPSAELPASAYIKDTKEASSRRASGGGTRKKKDAASANPNGNNPDSNPPKRRRCVPATTTAISTFPASFDSSAAPSELSQIESIRNTAMQHYVHSTNPAAGAFSELLNSPSTTRPSSSPTQNFGMYGAAPAAELSNMSFDGQINMTSQPLLQQPSIDSMTARLQTTSAMTPAQSAAEETMRHRSSLLALFMTDSRPTAYPVILYPGIPLPPNFDIDMALDDMGHSAMHFAAVLAQIEVLQLIVNKGASTTLRNKFGETALMRAVRKLNNFDMQTFPHLMSMLQDTIPLLDSNNATILHHIALASSVKGHTQACNYYLECLIDFIARDANKSTSVADEKTGLALSSKADISLGRMLNQADNQGNTAVNVAARVGCRSIVQLLLNAGANFNIANNAGLRPADFGFNINPVTKMVELATQQSMPAQVLDHAMPTNATSMETKADRTLVVYPSVRTEEEIQSTCQITDSAAIGSLAFPSVPIDASAQLRDLAHKLAESRRNNESLQARLGEIPELKLRIRNLEDALVEEMKCKPFGHNTSPIDRSRDAIQGSSSQTPVHFNALVDDEKLSPETLRHEVQRLRSIVKDMDDSNRGLLKDLVSLRGSAGQHELKCRRIIAACCNVALEDVGYLLDPLLIAVEADDGDLDMNMVANFMSRVIQPEQFKDS
ncbi:hypothetical protein BATDEDRAFT_35432 [Batrachochytrium dendrobatidis JAM81]|uniref:HTH APSES-type domain-containing protein n=1 Tax=Batrachochytrium dendrobatidis (strain JAM81 / FGSC 10211) TaxID=684364 RepID=F4P631_BATDJ|nr:uncharacterized protein BATDEDRAFT_35432 [Batrachochytrium dendrobatidis JAM81]EGF79532.1 hypothetical protein BATDEDRAFT_35432 [Batrachochytrium dendrobatidis JAM81]|eukprot:XP_006679997.1 hypothetical protein BATDEDRAFT_35432 [Batrachochytrium dendrobatidis JAM81]